MMNERRPRLAFDTGGTFTDLAFRDARGMVHIHKVLSTPHDPGVAVLRGLDEIRGRVPEDTDKDIEVVGATTVVTNAILERRGAKTAFLATEGFRDLLRIRTEARFNFYDLMIVYPEAIVPRNLCYGIRERTGVDGSRVREMSPEAVAELAGALAEQGVQSVAVCFLHSYRFDENEKRVRDIFTDVAPEIEVCLSSEVSPEVREYPRASTTVLNAYTLPIMRRHVDELTQGLKSRGMEGSPGFLTSSGGLVSSADAGLFPARLIESGPAAGALASAALGRQIGVTGMLSFDMGGTTAKMCLLPKGEPLISDTLEVARLERFSPGSGFPVNIRSVEMTEIGAGGGSIARVNHLGLLEVGPESAGAEPGPACYGLGGEEPTVTDADVVLGYLNPEGILGGAVRIEPELALKSVSRLATEMRLDATSCAVGIYQLVTENMAQAAGVHAAECGVDPSQLLMIAFGGAGPVHAVAVARKLNIVRILCPSLAGVMSAVGLIDASPAVDFSLSRPSALMTLDVNGVRQLVGEWKREGRARLEESGVLREEVQMNIRVDMRHVGQGHEISVPAPSLALESDQFKTELAARFLAEYVRLYGRSPGESDVEIITWRGRVFASDKQLQAAPYVYSPPPVEVPPIGARQAFFPEVGKYVLTDVYDFDHLGTGGFVLGPSIIQQRDSTVVVPPSAWAHIDGLGNIWIERKGR